MGTTDSNTDGAASRLAQLHAYFREHPVNGPDGHSYISSEPRPTTVTPGLPFNAGIVDHIQASVREVIDHTRAANPDAGPLPDHVHEVYAWAHQHTENAPEDVQQRRDTLEYRHRLEHAIAAGDYSVIRPHRCPDCGAPGLHWQEHLGVALCVNRHCARRNGGTHRQYDLARLAYEHIQTRKNLRQERAT
ncbi:hypothetical protein [Streptomyces sp. NPDC048521]|uniref:hypothetical protein n=1 Tax=Streptomyces sp. NPDC048521 TaxID=3365566 RepID=UPI003713F825